MSREIMQQALDVIIELYNERDEVCERTKNLYVAADKTIAALEAELAKPEQEPVAWMMPEYGDVLPASQADGTGIYNIPLYTSPPRKEWVGLTVDEAAQIIMDSDPNNRFELFRNIEAKLKEKNT